MKMRKWVRWGLGLTATLVVSMVVGGYIYLRSTLPSYDGAATVPTGLSAEVEIIRDSYGMAHIYAANEADACFALGYASAQDRLFQMEMIRRAVRGRLAEVVGKEAIDVDRLFRTITAPRPVDSFLKVLPPEVLSALTSFADGVNYYLAGPSEPLPFEFALLGIEPEPWQPADCLTGLYYLAWGLNFAFDSELLQAAVTARIGAALADEVFIDYPCQGPVTVMDSTTAQVCLPLLGALARAREMTGCPFPGASNNWVIAGTKSATGKPLVANDMHLGFSIPGIWYQAHLATPTLNVSGVILPGTPLVIAGANEHVAWGFTNLMTDDADFWQEQTDSLHPNQYYYVDHWEPMTMRLDSIRVRGGETVPITIQMTRHGVIMNDLIDSTMAPTAPITMRWTLWDSGTEAVAIYKLNRAGRIADIEEAARFYGCPGQNWVFADDAGNIGYRAAVAVPRRIGFDGRAILAGWDGRLEWSGYIPFDSLPSLTNPQKGWIATANNKPVGDEYPYYISHCYGGSERITRISRMLQEKEKISVEDCARMQGDDYLIQGELWSPKIVAALLGKTLDQTEQQALARLQSWDYSGSADSVAPAIFHVTFQQMLFRIFRPRLGDTLYQNFLTENVFMVFKAMTALAQNDTSTWFDNPSTAAMETMDTVLAQSFSAAVRELVERLGDDVDDWQWGKLHTITFSHPVGRYVPILGRLTNAGPYPMAGGGGSVNAALYRLSKPYAVVAGASQRHIFTVGDMSRSRWVIPTGVSGNFMSPYYKDQLELWRTIAYRPFVLDRAEVEKEAVHTLRLTPAGK